MAVSLERHTGIVALLYWIWDGVDRTIFTAIKFSFPARFVSPFGFLGMLTFTIFIILGVSGALLMFYYQPILDRAWDLSLIHISEPTRLLSISYAVFCLKKKKTKNRKDNKDR